MDTHPLGLDEKERWLLKGTESGTPPLHTHIVGDRIKCELSQMPTGMLEHYYDNDNYGSTH
jgi:hypothetical protein